MSLADTQFKSQAAVAWTFYEDSRHGERLKVRKFGLVQGESYWEITFVAPLSDYNRYIDEFDSIAKSLSL